MICVTVAPESRTLAKVDILNASRMGDIIELCLDHLIKEPDVKDLLEGFDKPIIVSCRKPADGGKWQGTEEERLMLLRQAIVCGPAYIELDLDIANKIPRFGKTQRVISFTRLDQPETDIDSIFDQAAEAKADVVKFTWPTPTIDAAWPLLAAVSQKRRLPIVGMGLGRADLTFSLLGRKYESPWIYAALEKGMETFPGQATVFDLDEIYTWRDINKSTAFVAVAGLGESQQITARIFNAAFKQIGANVRCLPIMPGNENKLKQMLEILKIKAVIIGDGLGGKLRPLAEHVDKHDLQSGYVDMLLKRDDGWHGYNTMWRSGLKSLEAAMGGGGSGQRPLDKRSVMVLGSSGIAESLVHAVTQRQGLVTICGPKDKESQRIAAAHNCRFVPFQNLYDTLLDVLIIADSQLQVGSGTGCVNASVCRPTHTVLDVSDPPREHPLFAEARARGCKVVEPVQVYLDQIKTQFKSITGQELPPAVVEKAFAE